MFFLLTSISQLLRAALSVVKSDGKVLFDVADLCRGKLIEMNVLGKMLNCQNKIKRLRAGILIVFTRHFACRIKNYNHM